MIGDLHDPDLSGAAYSARLKPALLEEAMVFGIHTVTAVVVLSAFCCAIELGGAAADRLLLSHE
jgi:hypothetical protein